ncbi:MAG: type II toxin-antitoxin system YafQ family toxin [Holophagales bacterium]|jgi:mRNA interferase YafQ|nr:type II toxin-antitoxin system YafQ family toxin [Holophagales bacterium]
MRETEPSGRFSRDLKKIEGRGLDVALLTAVIEDLASGNTLDSRHRDHQLKGKLKDYRECHITPDWLLVYRVSGNVLYLARTGTHAEVFKG